MPSIVIAAHNEASVIGRCLDGVFATAAPGEFDVTVVANGCTDATAELAAARTGVRVLDLPEPGKAAALNAGDEVAQGYPRVYLDADIVISTDGIRALCESTARWPAVSPRREVDVSHSPVLVRGYYAINARLPVFRHALFGRGVIALSAEGRGRFGRFPDLLADDLYVDSLFTAAEKRELDSVCTRVAAPRRTVDLVRRLVRVRRGNATLRAVQPDRTDFHGAGRRRARMSWLNDVVLRDPALLPAAICYAAITALAVVLARGQQRPDSAWGRDDSSRVPGGGGKHVLIHVQNLPVPFDRRVWQEALALTAAGYEVHVVCPRTTEYPRRRELLDGIHVYRYTPGPEARRAVAYPVEYSVALLAHLRLGLGIRLRHRIDVVHICNPPDLLFLAALPLVAAGARLIYDHHDAAPELMMAKGQPENGLLVRLMKLCERMTYRCAHVSIETNESFREIALRRGRMRPADVFVVRSAPSLSRFEGAQPDEAWRHGRKHMVGYLGIMGSQDGLDYLIDAADLIISEWRRDDIQFVLAGGGPELPRLQERVNGLGIADYVEFTGLVSSGQRLGSMICTADVCVAPDEANRMNDISTMNKIVEYMALGRPIVQFDLREGRVSAGPASLYAKRNDVSSLAEAIVRVIDDQELGARLGQLGRERFRASLSWEAQVPQLLAAYQRALQTTARNPR